MQRLVYLPSSRHDGDDLGLHQAQPCVSAVLIDRAAHGGRKMWALGHVVVCGQLNQPSLMLSSTGSGCAVRASPAPRLACPRVS